MGHKLREALSWRRNKVQDFLIQGLNQYEIADILKVSQPTINNDVQFLREKASEIMQNHIQDVLPAEFQSCLAGINRVLKMTWQIANNADNNSCEVVSSKVEDKIKLQALALANECYKYKMDLVTNGVVIKDAIRFIQQKKQELEKMNDGTKDIAQKAINNPNIDYNQKDTTNKLF